MSATPPPKAVLDCVVFVQAALSEQGPAARLLRMAEAHIVELVVSGAVLDEVAEVLERPSLRAKSPQLTLQRIDQFLDHVRRVATFVAEVPRLVRLERDPDDEAYVNLAIAAGVEYIVTRDRDLLDLSGEGVPMTASGKRLRIVTPEDFLAILLR